MGVIQTAEAEASEREWRSKAACLGADDEVFFPNGSKGEDAMEAKAICATCPVFKNCQIAADKHPPTAGVWAGVDYRKRRDGTLWN